MLMNEGARGCDNNVRSVSKGDEQLEKEPSKRGDKRKSSAGHHDRSGRAKGDGSIAETEELREEKSVKMQLILSWDKKKRGGL